MSRANVADAPARAGPRRNIAFFLVGIATNTMLGAGAFQRFAARHAPHQIRPLHVISKMSDVTRRANLELVARWAVPAALLVFLATIVTISLTFAYDDQGRMVGAATTELELAATVIADDIDIRMHDEPDMTPAKALAHALPAHALSRGQEVLLSDQAGRIVATYPATAAVRKTIGAETIGTVSEVFGTAQPMTVFAEKAGVMRLVLPSGAEVLATVRSLHEPLGQIAVVHPMESVLSVWRSALKRTLLLLAATAAVLVALAIAYLWQATRTRQADRFCRTMRDRVDMVLARGRCGLWDWNVASGHIDWSLSMYEMIGMTPTTKALSFAEIDALIHPDDGGLNAMARSLTKGATHTIDHVFRLRTTKNEWAWMRAKMELVKGEDGGSPRLVGIAIDVTETMALEERTAKADMRLRDAIETISEAFVVWDADNRLVMCNSKFQRFHDLPAEAVTVGTPYAQVMERGTPPLIQSQVPLATPQPMGARTFEAQLGDGRWLQINERRTKDGGYVSVGTDITALKRNEEQLIESERRLMSSVVDLRKSRQILETQAQQLAELAEKYLEQKADAENANRAKSDFLANMGHELRTPLNAILGFSEIMMLQAYGELGSPLYAEYCKDIHTSGQYLLNVIADVLEMSHLEAGRVLLEKQDFLVDSAIEGAVKLVADAALANAIAIGVKASPNAKLHGDRAAIEKIVGILLNNAVKYTPSEGRVSIRTQNVQGAMNIYVEDTGCGIAPEAMERLGRPFEQSDPAMKNGMRGSGLGLAIARSLIDLHGGTMRIHSRQGLGTMVLVTLPNKHNGPAPRPNLATVSTMPTMSRATPRPVVSVLHQIDSTASKISRTA